MTTPDFLQALIPVVTAFEKIAVPYYVAGSVASSTHGVARTTMDVDVVADMSERHVVPFVKALEKDYYVSQDMILNGVRTRSFFNVIHLGTMFKVDIFLLKAAPYDLQSFKRRTANAFDIEGERRSICLQSPEDVVLSKLTWFRKTGESSEKQWSDVLGVLRVQKDCLDRIYLTEWAKRLNLFPLLEKAVKESNS